MSVIYFRHFNVSSLEQLEHSDKFMRYIHSFELLYDLNIESYFFVGSKLFLQTEEIVIKVTLGTKAFILQQLIEPKKIKKT